MSGNEKLSKNFCPLEIREDLKNYLEKLNQDLEPGRFRFCEKGGKIPTHGKAGQMTTCFAIRTAVQCGIWQDWSNKLKKESIKFIKSFQVKKGFFIDPWLAKSCELGLSDFIRHALFNRSLNESRLIHEYNHKSNLRAETRQSSATLQMADSLPNYLLPLEVYDETSLNKFLKSVNWDNPWHANSQVSHQIVVLSINKKIDKNKLNYDFLIKKILGFFDSIYEQNTGTWVLKKNIDKQSKLNGAMKLYSGLQWIKSDRKKPNKKLIDFALEIPIEFDGCNFTNSLYAIYHARKNLVKYRKDEIISRAIQCLNHSMNHKIKGSGYSFHFKSCQKNYYTQKVSNGGNQADIHGTGMFSLGIVIALKLLGDFAPKGSEYWKYIKT